MAESSARWCGHCGEALHRTDAPGAATPPEASPIAPVTDDEGPVAAEQPLVSRRSRLLGAAAVSTVLLGLLGVQATRPPPEEPHGYTARGVPERTGVAAATSVEPPTGVAWEVGLTLPPLTTGGATVRTSDELAYVLDLDGRTGVTAHDVRSGAVRWSRSDLALSEASPFVAGDTLVAELRDGSTIGLGPDGRTRWLHDVGAEAPVAAGGGIADVDGSRAVELWDATTGELRWRLDVVRELDASAQYVLSNGPDDLVVALVSRPRGLTLGSNPELERGHLIGIDADSGELRWEIDLLPALAWFQSPVALDGHIAVAANGAEMAFWDVRTGRELGRHERGLVYPPMAVSAAAGAALVLDPTGTLTAIEPDGSERWRASTSMPASVDVRGELVLLGTASRVLALDARTGEVVGGQPVDRSARRGPPGADGAAYALRADGHLLSYDPRGGIRFDEPTLVPEAASPAVADGMLFASTGAGVSVLSAEDGVRQWEFHSGDPTASIAGDLYTPVVDDEVVIVSPPRSQPLEAGGVYALQRETGILVWNRLTDRPSPRGPLTFDRDLALLPVGGEVHGHAPASGRRALAAPARDRRGPVAASVGMLVATSETGEAGSSGPRSVVAIRRADRSVAWEQVLPTCTPPTVADGIVVVGTRGGLAALDLMTGEPRWTAPGDGRPVCLELALAGGRVVGVAGTDRLVAYDPQDGTPVWQRDLPAAVAASPAIAGGELLVPLLDGSVLGVALDDGELRWGVDVDGVVAASPVVADGRVVLLLRDGRLLALD